MIKIVIKVHDVRSQKTVIFFVNFDQIKDHKNFNQNIILFSIKKAIFFIPTFNGPIATEHPVKTSGSNSFSKLCILLFLIAISIFGQKCRYFFKTKGLFGFFLFKYEIEIW